MSYAIQDVWVQSNSTGLVSLQYQFFKMSFLVPGDLCRDTEVFDHQYWDKRSRRLSWLIMWRAMRDLWTKRQGGFRNVSCATIGSAWWPSVSVNARRPFPLSRFGINWLKEEAINYTWMIFFTFLALTSWQNVGKQAMFSCHFAILQFYFFCSFEKQVAVDPVESSKILQLCNSLEVTWLRLIEVGWHLRESMNVWTILETFEEVTQRGDWFCFLLIQPPCKLLHGRWLLYIFGVGKDERCEFPTVGIGWPSPPPVLRFKVCLDQRDSRWGEVGDGANDTLSLGSFRTRKVEWFRMGLWSWTWGEV